MKTKRLDSRTLSLALAVVLSMLAIRAVAGDTLHGFVDGMVAGFTDGV